MREIDGDSTLGSVGAMTARGLGRTAARLARSLASAGVRSRATEFGRSLKAAYEAGKDEGPADPDETSEAADAEAVADAMRGVDWSKVRSATSERGAEAAQAMKSMAAEVDWAKVQPVAAKVSSALIAAVASGQMGIGGTLGGTVARAIMNDHNLAHRVSGSLARQAAPMPPDFLPAVRDGVIDATARDA